MGGWSPGGKSGGQPLCLLRVSQPGIYVCCQRRLVVFPGKNVVAAGLDNLRAEVALAEQGIAGEDVPRDRQNTQQSQRRLVFVGLGIDFYLAQNGLGFAAIEGAE